MSEADEFIENGEIESAHIRFDRGFALTCWLFLKFDGTGQGFGGYVLGGSPFDKTAICARHSEQKNLAAEFIGGVMGVVGVEEFDALKGRVVRVKRASKFGDIIAIGHPVKDRWFNPKERFEALTA